MEARFEVFDWVLDVRLGLELGSGLWLGWVAWSWGFGGGRTVTMVSQPPAAAPARMLIEVEGLSIFLLCGCYRGGDFVVA